MRATAFISLLILCVLVLPADPRADGDPDTGRKVSVAHCSRCHVVGDHNPYGGINSTPSFQLLAKRNDWLERFQTFYERRPHPVFIRVPDVPRWTGLPANAVEIEITAKNIEDIVAFVRTLTPR